MDSKVEEYLMARIDKMFEKFADLNKRLDDIEDFLS